MPASRRATRALVLTVAAALTGQACGDEIPELDPAIQPVRTVTVGMSSGERVRQFSGVTRAGTESTLSFKLAGTVSELPAKVGQRIEKGTLLANLDPADYQLRVQRAHEGLRQAQAEARRAAANHERMRLLYENNNATIADLEAARAAEESIAAAVGGAQKSLELARLLLSYTELRAPVSGAIASVHIEVKRT